MLDSAGQESVNRQFKSLRRVQNLINIVEQIMIKPKYKFPLLDLETRSDRNQHNIN